MNASPLREHEERKRRIRARPDAWNGIDYLETLDREPGVAPEDRQRLLRVFFLTSYNLSDLRPGDFRIEGGQRITDVAVLRFRSDDAYLDSARPRLLLETNHPGDYSTYRLRLAREEVSGAPPPGFDPVLSSVAFTFKAECPTDADCRAPTEHAPAPPASPPIDYLTRDFVGFRQALLDRLHTLLPDWQDSGPADPAVAIVELLAHAADLESYRLDAAATEAYLGTARRRVSIRRHARLLDYALHEGCNARVFVAFYAAPGAGGRALPRGTALLTAFGGGDTIVDADEAARALVAGGELFETLHDVALWHERNELAFYGFGARYSVLPAGAVRAVLRAPAGVTANQAAQLFRRGDALIFIERVHPDSGDPAAARADRRHVVRLAENPTVYHDALFASTDEPAGPLCLEIVWHPEDATPFDFFVGETAAGPLSAALGNIALADHGQTRVEEPEYSSEALAAGRLQLRLSRKNLTWSEPYDQERARSAPARDALTQDPRAAAPALTLRESGETWRARRDLLGSDRFAAEFVVEMDDEGRASIRFGDDLYGRRPALYSRFEARYRTGNGRSGNAGVAALAHVVRSQAESVVELIEKVCNPLAARGGTDPEDGEQARLYAPESFKSRQSAVTEADYSELARRHPEVQGATAILRWTGSWHTVFLAVDRRGGLPVDAAFQRNLARYMENARLVGHDLEIRPPRFIPVEITLRVTPRTGRLWSVLCETLRDRFSRGLTAEGRPGFFHPDNFSFGQSLFLSPILTLVMQTPGVERVEALRFRRFDDADRINEGRINVERFEILRLDNDPNAPEQGRIEFVQGAVHDDDVV